VVDSLKALDPNRPIREADIRKPFQKVGLSRYDALSQKLGVSMRRREFLGFVGAAMSVPSAVRAQQIRLVGVLMNGTSDQPETRANVEAFSQELRKLGWVEGRNLRLEIRWNGGSADQARIYAVELASLKPDVVLCATTPNLIAMRPAAGVIPIVFVQVSDPVAQGFVHNITKPGGNITGFSAYEFSIGGKWLELLKEIAPKLTRVGVMFNPDTSPQSQFFVSAIVAASQAFGVQVVTLPVRATADIESAIESLSHDFEGGLILPTDTFTRTREDLIAGLTARHRVPAVSSYAEFIDLGGLMFYGPSTVEQMTDQYRQAATYADRILKGAKPGDLPIQGVSKFSLFINRKTAAAMGLEIPPRLLFTADRVIE